MTFLVLLKISQWMEHFCGRDDSYRHRIERRVIDNPVLEEYNGEIRIESLGLEECKTEFKVEEVKDSDRCELCGMRIK